MSEPTQTPPAEPTLAPATGSANEMPLAEINEFLDRVRKSSRPNFRLYLIAACAADWLAESGDADNLKRVTDSALAAERGMRTPNQKLSDGAR